MPPRTPRHLIPALLVAAFAAMPSSAALLVYEDFTYAASNGASFNGVATSATGISGNWTVSNGSGGSSTYLSSGLSFGSEHFASAGGALRQTGTASSGTASTILGAAWSAGTVTGTVYTSFLFQNTARTTATAAALSVSRINNAITASGTSAWFNVQPEVNGGTIGAAGLGYSPTIATTSATVLDLSTTYLALARFTNVGSALSTGSPGTATAWIFTQAGYEAWRAAGSLEADLGTHAAATVVSSATTGTYTLDNTRFVQFGLSASNINGQTQTTIYDELRYGTALGDVVNTSPVPEPSSAAVLAGLAALGLGFTRRRRR